MISPAVELWEDLRAAARWIALAALLGAAAGAGAELLRPTRWAATATMLASAHTPDPDGFRRRPISVDELRAHLDPSLLTAAAGRARVPPGEFHVEVAARSESGLYDLTAVSRDPAVAAPAASATVEELVARLRALRERKAAAQLATDALAMARVAREAAAAAYVADVAGGVIEVASTQAARAEALARRESLRIAYERAEAALGAEEAAIARARASALALEPAAEVFANAGEVRERAQRPLRAGAVGGATGLFLAVAAVLLLGRPGAGRAQLTQLPARQTGT